MPKHETLATGNAGLALTTEDALHQAEALALFLVMAGRGGSGKTLLLRWICERAIGAGRSLVIADGDRTNRSLPLFLDGVLNPPGTEDPVVWRWLETVIEKMVADRFHLALDLGGGDLVLKRMALELALHDMLVRHEITPVVLHLLSPEVESLAYLASLEQDKLFAPERAVLILNAGLVPRGHNDDAAAFQRVREHKVFRTAISRGAVSIAMPRLIPAHEINARHISFIAAAGGQTSDGLPPLGIFDRQRVLIWLKAMEAAFAPIAEWLP